MSVNAAGIEVFEGFKIKYPEYSIVTPQTLIEFTIRTLTIAEEEVLKGSLLVPNKMAQHLNEIIFSCLVKKPDDIKTLQDFTSKITIKDRDALMFGLYAVTYKDIHNYDVTCSECRHVNSVKINIAKSFKANLWPKDSAKPITETEIPVKLEIASEITAIIAQPLLRDEIKLLNDATFASDSVRDMNLQLLIIRRFEMNRPEAKTPHTLLERENILKGYKELPAPDKKLIENAYAENFGKYEIDVASLVKCQKCGQEDTISIDLVRQFFRAIY